MIGLPVRCVVDASVGVKLEINEADSPNAYQLFAHLADPAAEFFVPALFYLEAANIFWKLVQRAQMPATDAPAKLARMKALRMTSLPAVDLVTDALDIALKYGVSTYDGCYLAASLRTNVPLVTADQRLANKVAGSSLSVEVLSTLVIPVPPQPP